MYFQSISQKDIYFTYNYSLLTNLFNFISLYVVILQKYFQQSVSTSFLRFMLFWDCLPKARFLIKLLINANQIKLKYSLLTSSFIQCCNKGVITYSGASVSEFIHAIRSFISVDIDTRCRLYEYILLFNTVRNINIW